MNSYKQQIFTFSNENETHLQSITDFSLFIEELACNDKITYVEAVLEYCAEHKIDPEDISKLLSSGLRSKMIEDFRELNYLPKQAKLDL